MPGVDLSASSQAISNSSANEASPAKSATGVETAMQTTIATTNDFQAVPGGDASTSNDPAETFSGETAASVLCELKATDGDADEDGILAVSLTEKDTVSATQNTLGVLSTQVSTLQQQTDTDGMTDGHFMADVRKVLERTEARAPENVNEVGLQRDGMRLMRCGVAL